MTTGKSGGLLALAIANLGVSAYDIAVRFVMGGSAVALSAAVAKLAGGRLGGVFAAFPAVFISAVVTSTLGLSAADADGKAIDVSQGALIGMSANVVCALAASRFIRAKGTALGLTMAVGVWLIVSCAAFFSAVSLGLLD